MNTIFRFGALFAFAGAPLLGACRSDDKGGNAAAGGSAAAANPAAGSLEGPTRRDSAGGMAGMQGMQGGQTGGMMGAGMMDSMSARMRMMDGMSADQMRAMLPMHRQMVADMLARMNLEMRSMGMPADAARNATADSVRQDLARMPEMSAQELKAMMPAHRARVTRLMAMHQAMTRGMKR